MDQRAVASYGNTCQQLILRAEFEEKRMHLQTAAVISPTRPPLVHYFCPSANSYLRYTSL